MDTSVESLSSFETSFPDLSSIQQEQLQNATSTIQNLLSSLKQINADIAAAREEIPTDPYERLKWEHCHKDIEPLDFESVEVPEDFCFDKAHKALTEISKKHSDNFNDHLNVASLSGFDPNEHHHFGNAFAAFDGGTFQLDKDKITKHFQFLDMVRSVPLDYIINNPNDFNKKVLTKFIEIYN